MASSEELQLEVERLRAADPTITQEAMAAQLGVSVRTVGRAVAAMRKENRLMKSEIRQDRAVQREALENIFDTYQTLNRSVLKSEKMVERLEEILTSEQLLCDVCQRKMDPKNADRWANYFNGRRELAKQIELMARMLGQIENSPVAIVMQIDEDHERIMRYFYRIADVGALVVDELEPEMLASGLDAESIAKIRDVVGQIGPRLARELYFEITSENERRKRRMPEFVQIIDGEPVGG